LFERSREGPETGNYHFEIELVVALVKGGRDIAVEQALDHVFGYAVGLDMTRRDLQDEAKQLRRPWELCKAADLSGPVGPIHPAPLSATRRTAPSP
jgi:fumarylpyruvate hydrolase